MTNSFLNNASPNNRSLTNASPNNASPNNSSPNNASLTRHYPNNSSMAEGFSAVLWVLIGLCCVGGLGFLGISAVLTSPIVTVLNAGASVVVAGIVIWLLSHHAAWPRPFGEMPSAKSYSRKSGPHSWWGTNSWWIAAFLWGGSVCTLGAQLFAPAMTLMEKLGLPVFTASFAGAYPEEFLKAVGVLVIALASTYVLRPWHTFMVGFMVGLGFEVVENCYYSVSLAVLDPTSDLSGALTSWGTRMLLGVFLHPICTAVAGYGIGHALFRARWPLSRRLWTAAGFYLIGFGLHFLWNMSLSNEAVSLGILIGVGVVLYSLGIYFLIRMHRDATGDRSYAVTTVASSWAPSCMISSPVQ